MAARDASDAVVVVSASAGITAAVAALALWWRARVIALVWRAGFAAGLAWSLIRRLGIWLSGGVRRDIG